jgi:nitrogen fixation NifU-like protein
VKNDVRSDAGSDPTPATLAAMYQEELLAHYRSPHNRRDVPRATGIGSRRNPLCGDEIGVAVLVEDGVIADAGFSGRGCSIATASASMLTDVVRGLPPHDALAIADSVDAMLRGETAALPDELRSLHGVAPFPARHGCATMPWAALRDALAHASASAHS